MWKQQLESNNVAIEEILPDDSTSQESPPNQPKEPDVSEITTD